MLMIRLLSLFGARPEATNRMQPGPGLAEFASRALVAVSNVLPEVKPGAVPVQGDATSWPGRI